MRKKKNQIEEIQKEFLRKKSLFKCIRWERTEDHPTLQVELTLKRNEKGQIVFSCSGTISLRECGQCEDSINEYLKGNPLRDKIYYLRKEYHLNDMHAGTPKQENLLKMGRLAGVDLSDYILQCCFLVDYHMLYDDREGKQYKYGRSRLYRPIPEADLWDILSIMLDENI